MGEEGDDLPLMHERGRRLQHRHRGGRYWKWRTVPDAMVRVCGVFVLCLLIFHASRITHHDEVFDVK